VQQLVALGIQAAQALDLQVAEANSATQVVQQLVALGIQAAQALDLRVAKV
jgi:hypothetical protein